MRSSPATSFAAAHATGVVALLMERDPELDAETHRRDSDGEHTHSVGRASINACRALTRVGVTAACTGGAARANF